MQALLATLALCALLGSWQHLLGLSEQKVRSVGARGLGGGSGRAGGTRRRRHGGSRQRQLGGTQLGKERRRKTQGGRRTGGRRRQRRVRGYGTARASAYTRPALIVIDRRSASGRLIVGSIEVGRRRCLLLLLFLLFHVYFVGWLRGVVGGWGDLLRIDDSRWSRCGTSELRVVGNHLGRGGRGSLLFALAVLLALALLVLGGLALRLVEQLLESEIGSLLARGGHEISGDAGGPVEVGGDGSGARRARGSEQVLGKGAMHDRADVDQWLEQA